MVMLATSETPVACWEFEGDILVLHHPTTISTKYQAMGQQRRHTHSGVEFFHANLTRSYCALKTKARIVPNQNVRCLRGNFVSFSLPKPILSTFSHKSFTHHE